jgi:hypothetical protein
MKIKCGKKGNERKTERKTENERSRPTRVQSPFHVLPSRLPPIKLLDLLQLKYLFTQAQITYRLHDDPCTRAQQR